MPKVFKFQNGQTFDTLPEVKAYIRGLELARLAAEGKDFQEKIAQYLDEAHTVKATVEKKK